MVVAIASDEPLLERLRVLVSDPTTDSHVKRKAVELFGSWSVNFRNEKGMERLVGLRSQMPTKVSLINYNVNIDVETRCSASSTPDPRK
jgi:hypothetical protein